MTRLWKRRDRLRPRGYCPDIIASPPTWPQSRVGRVHEHQPERLPPLDAVHETVERALLQERAEHNLQAGLARLRSLYRVRVERSL